MFNNQTDDGTKLPIQLLCHDKFSSYVLLLLLLLLFCKCFQHACIIYYPAAYSIFLINCVEVSPIQNGHVYFFFSPYSVCNCIERQKG